MTTTDLVPVSGYPSRNRSPYTIADERRIQPYQQPRSQAWAQEPSQEPLVSNPNAEESASESCKKHLTTKLFMSIFIGLVICGIPLAVMSSLYAQKKASPSSDSGSSGSSDNSVSLPSQCTTYTAISDSTRLASFTSCTSCFYDTSTYFSTAWYRFVDPAGYRLPATPSSTGNCGATWPTWYNGTYPSTTGSTISSVICVNVGGALCSPSYLISISITNCNGFYVYYLTPTTTTNIRYCSSY